MSYTDHTSCLNNTSLILTHLLINISAIFKESYIFEIITYNFENQKTKEYVAHRAVETGQHYYTPCISERKTPCMLKFVYIYFVHTELHSG